VRADSDRLMSAMRLTLPLIAHVVALAMTSTAFAGDRDRVEEVVVTATRTEQQLRDFAGSISVVSSNDVALVGATHHAEIMNRAPGTMIQRNSGEESLTAIRSPVLTGPGSCGTFLFLENSIPIRPVGFCNVNELFEVNSEQASSIEVLRGPAGVVYGSGAMHGAINVIQAAPAQMPRSSLSLEGGPDEFYRGRLTLSNTGAANDFGGAVVATHDGGWRDHSGLDEQKLNLAMMHRGDDSTLGVQFAGTNLNQETAGFIQGFEAYKDENIAKSNANPEAYRDAYAMRLTADYTRPLGGAQLSIRPFVRHSRMDFLQHFLIGKPLEENGQDSLGVATSLQTVLFADTQLLAGVDLEYADGFLKETQAGPATDGTPLGEVRDVLLEELEVVRRDGLADSELTKAKAQLKARLVFDNESITDIAHQLGYFATIASVDSFLEAPAQIAAVTLEEVSKVARSVLTASNRTVGTFEPLDLKSEV